MVGWFIYGTLHAFIPGMLLKGRKSDLRGKDTHVIFFTETRDEVRYGVFI